MASPNRCTPKLNSDVILNVVFIVAWPNGHKIGVYTDRKRQQPTTHALAQALVWGRRKEIASFKMSSKLQRERLHQSHALAGTPGPAATYAKSQTIDLCTG